MGARPGVRSARLEKGLVAELLLAGLLLGYGFAIPRVVPLLLLASMSLWVRGLGWADLGLRRPRVWSRTVATAVLAALGILLAVRFVIAPLAVWVTGTSIDQSVFEPLRGNLRVLLASLLLAWTLAAFGEEMVFRGYLMRRLTDLVGGTRVGWAVALVVSSAFFGWAHGYQGPAGMVATGLIGASIGLLYLRTGRNLWMAIICHAVVDTVALTLVYLGRTSLLFP
ncbi:MAG TPA: type II CAAX endopeptidase family protein [Longimicrobium sp.]|nr:type II CAAX endopeptidase family protein [Longimicrobium sp.]